MSGKLRLTHINQILNQFGLMKDRICVFLLSPLKQNIHFFQKNTVTGHFIFFFFMPIIKLFETETSFQHSFLSLDVSCESSIWFGIIIIKEKNRNSPSRTSHNCHFPYF
jgi:hypothetical protein